MPQAATAAAAALYVTDRAGVLPIGRRLSPQPRDFDLRRKAICSTGLPFNGLHPSNPYNMDCYLITDPDGMKAELTWLVDPKRTVYPQSGHMSTIDQA